ncbi:MAG: TorF family putative porin [Pseudolabrys sp.]|nr:TorF family putative porin [Pseudolabrys sp.]
MKKVVLSVVAALAVSTAAPAFAADMPVKAYKAAPAPYVSPWDIAFGTAFTSDYVLRGISQSNRHAAVQGYFEGSYTATPWLSLYAGLWGSSLYSGFGADAEYDVSGGARFSYEKFGLDLGYVFYIYPGTATNVDYGEFYAKASVTLTDWLSVGGTFIGGNDFGNSGNDAWYYSGTVTVTLPEYTPLSIGTAISGEVGRQTYASAIGLPDYTVWNIGVAFSYKAMTLDLRYWDTDLGATAGQCTSTPTSGAAKNICDQRFVATLKFDTSLAALK